MSDLRESVREITNSKEPLEVRKKKLSDLGLSQSSIRELLYREIIKKEHEEAAIRLNKRMNRLNQRLAKEASEVNTSGQMKCLAIRQP